MMLVDVYNSLLPLVLVCAQRIRYSKGSATLLTLYREVFKDRMCYINGLRLYMSQLPL